MKKSVQEFGPSPTASTSGVYTDLHLRPVAGLRWRWISKPVAMSSVIESYSPPICRSAEIRTALDVPTNIGAPYRLPARWIRAWKRNCCDSAALVTKVS